MQFDRSTCRVLSEIAEKAVAEKLKELGHDGLTVRAGAGNYTSTSFSLKLEFATKAADGTVMTREAQAFKANAAFFRLRADWLGKEFTSRDVRYRIIGLKPNAPKFPVIAERVRDSRPFKFPAGVVRAAMGVREAA